MKFIFYLTAYLCLIAKKQTKIYLNKNHNRFYEYASEWLISIDQCILILMF